MIGERGVAQTGSALEWGSRGREFKSRRPDHFSRATGSRKMPYEARHTGGRSRAKLRCRELRACPTKLERSRMAIQNGTTTKHHVYLLRSLTDPKQTYIGLTENIQKRL